jgi:hypothetical protein
MPDGAVARNDSGSYIFNDPAKAQAYIDAHPEVYKKEPAAPAKPATTSVDDNAFVDYLHQMSANGSLGNLPAVKYDSSNASANYKAALIAGNPKLYAAWVANQGKAPAAPVQAAAANTAAATVPTPPTTPTPPVSSTNAPVANAPAANTPAANTPAPWVMTPEERATEAAIKLPQLNAEGTAPAGQTKASFGDWLKDKFGKKADKMDFWDAIEIWGAALAGNEPRAYNAKLQKLKDEKDRAQRATELTEERAFQEKLQTMLADRETQKLLAMQSFEANQANAAQAFTANQANTTQAFTANQNALDRALRERELAQQRALIESQVKANAFNYGGLRPQADRANIYTAQ